MNLYKSLLTYPLKTNELTGVIFDKLSRVFDGRNPVYNYQFENSEMRDDWEYYRQEILNEPTVWSSTAWEYFKTEINSIVIVDLPLVQVGDRPEPYFYFLTLDHVIDYNVADNESGLMEWVLFHYKGNIHVYDDLYYRVYKNDDGQIGELLVENEHDLGYCPVSFFWNQSISNEEPDIKLSPLSRELSSLDWYLYFSTSKRHLDLYASYPIISIIKSKCDYRDGHKSCKGGYLFDGALQKLMFGLNGELVPCPQCAERNLTGAGSVIDIPVPTRDIDLRNPVQVTSIDRQSLDFNVDEQERLKNEIIESVCGVDEMLTTSQAINETQVESEFESQSTVLNKIKKGFENIQNFVDTTCCKLRYGSGFLSANINIGTEFYLYSSQTLRSMYKTAKENGSSESQLDALNKQIIETEYRNDPIQMQRAIILNDLEPYRNLGRNEAIELNSRGLISKDDLIIKLNLPMFVDRFERENINIIEFGSNIDYKNKIETIINQFREYVKEQSITTEI